jgi:hypothetical protein
MDRRNVLLGLASMFGAELLAPIRLALANGMDPVKMSGAALFDAAQRGNTAALAETIIPATDTPGAREAGVADFIEYMLQEWYPDEDRERFIRGLATLQAQCDAMHGETFSKLSPDRQIEVVTALMNGAAGPFDDGGKQFFEHAKQLTLFGYYSSEIGMTLEREKVKTPMPLNCERRWVS